ncbi:hypothetical protein Hsar01_00097 [Haloferula sargassicola]|uniref:Uncharacterized protein n=2 Tax=Haloferula sargassicola TaxID=490096 RepID=A0ABP9UGU6_9BACT
MLAAVLCAASLAPSCVPYIEEEPPVPAQDVAQNRPAQTEKEKEQARRERQERREREQREADREDAGNDRQSQADNQDQRIPDRTPDPEPEPESKPRTPVAKGVPGKPGFVFSPFNNKIIDVKGIPSGTMVMDPTYPASDKKYFRVP